jgi:hypothetical protein
MTDLYLIAHKVNGEPAFDIAMRMECPECRINSDSPDCMECDGTGYWWIIPTSGHRAYPAKGWQLVGLRFGDLDIETDAQQLDFDSLPDHYAHSASPTVIRDRLASLLAQLPPAPTVPFKRRF